MKTYRRSLVIVVFALLIAGLLIWKEVDQLRAIDEYNREQIELARSGYPHDGHIDDPGDLALGISWLLALGIVAIEGRALVIAMRRDRAGRKEAT